jgi:MFS family permease
VRLSFPTAGKISRQASAAARPEYPAAFWWYLGGAGLIAFGFADWSLVAYHFAKAGVVSGIWVPMFYAFAMGAGGLGSLIFGRLFDRYGLIVLIPLTVGTALFAPLAFLGNFSIALIGSLLWGLGLGVHESVMSAAVAKMVPQAQRGTAYGLFTAAFGMCWFVGSAVEGALYDVSVPALVVVALVAQAAGCIPIITAARLKPLHQS